MPGGPALVVVDVQRGFHDPRWPARNNPGFEANLRQLLDLWRDRRWPLVYVKHDSIRDDSPFAPGTAGNELDADLLDAAEPDVLIAKSTNSAFLGTPSLKAWLDDREIETVVIAGIQTNHCAESTARTAGDLGYRMRFVIDATYTFDLEAPDGVTITADELTRATAANLAAESGEVLTTEDLVTQLTARP
jgi:nicotinamidase-related amidase